MQEVILFFTTAAMDNRPIDNNPGITKCCYSLMLL